MMSMGNALRDEFVQIVGEGNVCNDRTTLYKYVGGSAYSPHKTPALIVWPHSSKEVQQIVETANRLLVPLVPVSSRRDGLQREDTVRVDDAVVVDLSKMREILRIDRKNKVIMIEPGVTFEELAEVAKKNGLRILMPLLPPASKSVIASHLDREPITTQRSHWDTSDPLLCTEVVFGTGDLFRTGTAAGPGSLEEQWASGQGQKNPMGPSQFDPFRLLQGSQGAIGIVTWATVKCEVLPDLQRVMLVPSDSIEQLFDFMYSLFRRRLCDDLFILDSTDMAAALGQDVMEIMSIRETLPEWCAIAGVTGHGIMAEEELEYKTADLREIADESGVTLCERVGDVTADRVLSLIGRPSPEPYWKTRPLGDYCEVFFITTLDRTSDFWNASLRLALDRGLTRDRLGCYIQPLIQGTQVHFGLDIFCITEERSRTEEFALEVSRTALEMGAFFSRPHGPITEEVFKKCTPTTIKAMQTVKDIFDPRGILNPGVLCFKGGA